MSGSALTRGGSTAGVLLFGLVLLLPGVQAADLVAELEHEGAVTLTGNGLFASTDGAIDLHAQDSIPPYAMTLKAAKAEVTTYSWERQYAQAPLIQVERAHDPKVVTETLTDVTVHLQSLRPGAHLVWGLDDGNLAAAFQEATLQGAEGIWFSPDPDDMRQVEFSESTPYMTHASDQMVLATTDAAFDLAGAFTLAVFEADLHADAREGTRTYHTGDRQEGPQHFTAEQIQTATRRLIRIAVEDGQASVLWSGPSHTAASAPTVDLLGTLSTASARGDLVFDRLSLTPRDEPITATGTLRLTPTTSTEATGLRADADAPVRYHDRSSLQMGGDAETLLLSQEAVNYPWQDDGVGLGTAAAAGAGLLGMALALWRYGPLAFAALYSRLEQGALLNNPVRAQIYEIVCQNPGISARRVHNLSDASWGTVVHHLAKLEEAGYLAVRSQGRAKCYYENHGKWDGQQAQVALLSRRKTRSVADAVVSVPGRDQAGLVARTGLPQSTVSYHLLKLEKEGLVSKERVGASLCYYPTPSLRSVLVRLGETGQQTPAAAVPSGGTA